MSLPLAQPQLVRIQTPSRLHLGIFALPEGGYGGIGLAINQPRVRIQVEDSPVFYASGPQSGRALKAAEAVAALYAPGRAAHITVAEAIPPHIGLGSGTQIALAACTAVARLWDLNLPLEQAAALAGRGGRSRIGLEAFRRGGFTAHATWRSRETATRLRRFPSDWRFVVAAPRGNEGLSGQSEDRAFAELPPMSPATRIEARDIVETEVLPGVEKADLTRFGRGLTALQALVGDYFAPVQGGRYAHAEGERLADAMLSAGAAGVGQSSWGPAICGVVGSQSRAEAVRSAVLSQFAPGTVAVWVAAPDNSGTRWEWSYETDTRP